VTSHEALGLILYLSSEKITADLAKQKQEKCNYIWLDLVFFFKSNNMFDRLFDYKYISMIKVDHFNFSSKLMFIYQNVSIFLLCAVTFRARPKDSNWASALAKAGTTHEHVSVVVRATKVFYEQDSPISSKFQHPSCTDARRLFGFYIQLHTFIFLLPIKESHRRKARFVHGHCLQLTESFPCHKF